MKIWLTEIKAIDPFDGKLKIWAGDNIDALSWIEAYMKTQQTGRGYMRVLGELIAEIPCKSEEDLAPNMEKIVDFELRKLN